MSMCIISIVSVYTLTFFVTEKVKGIDKLWFVGDDWMSETYRPYFKKSKAVFHCKQMFEISKFCNTRLNSNNRNVVSRILNTFISAINEVGVFPKFIVFVLDDELITAIDYDGYGVSTMFGSLLEWLIKKVNATIDKLKKKLPAKLIKEDFPQIYWSPALMHKRFGDKNNTLRHKYNLCLDSIIKLYPNMRVIRYKNFWAFSDDTLMHENGQFSATGKSIFWKSIDDSLKFNVEKKEEYLARALLAQKKQKSDMSCQQRLDQKKLLEEEDDPVEQFFHRRRQAQHRCKNGNNFMLPRPDRCC